MRTLAIGDIHGCLDALFAVLKHARVTDQDRVIWLGDYVDRGPDSSLVIEHLCKLCTERNVFLRGNHEVMMLEARESGQLAHSWAESEGKETWGSYLRSSDNDNGIDVVPVEHWQFIRSCRDYFETKTHIFVHASIDAEIPMEQQFEETMFWGDFDSIGPHISGKHVVCGHSAQKDGVPKSRPHATCIDTWACGDGWLTCLDVQAGRYYQANQQGELRTEWLE